MTGDAAGLCLTRWLYLRLLGLIHLSAFASYATMIIGLNGEHGILPCSQLLSANVDLGFARFFFLPTLSWLNCSDAFLQGMTVAGVVASLLVVAGILTGPALTICLVLWLSIVAQGGEFTQFQSDGMLVEATLLTLFIVPWNVFEPPWPVRERWRRQGAPLPFGMLLLRFMVFRLMLAAGLVKLLSGDSTWADFSALQYHFFTQPIPTPLAWYANQLPPFVLKSFVAGMFVIELILPFLVWGPRLARLIAATGFILLHLGISLTGNYTFLNYLSITLSIPVLDDVIVKKLLPAKLVSAIEAATTEPPQGLPKRFIQSGAAVLLTLAGGQLLGTLIGTALLLTPVLVILSPLEICNRYGLFAVMTTTRPEIVIQGSNDGVQWQTYEFLYKVSDDLKRPPPWVAPHMPRLDWRLWFAAMEPYQANPWVLNLLERMLQGQKEVLAFFSKNPFPDKPPRYVRALVYDYHFTDGKMMKVTGNWWWRDNERVYLPPLTLDGGTIAPAQTNEPIDLHSFKN